METTIQKEYKLGLGTFGQGGDVSTNTQDGGGGGWYGGGGATSGDPAAGGGSSYISGYIGCDSIEEESTEDNIIHNGDNYSWTGYYFRNTQMIDGNGYLWQNKSAGNLVGQPTYNGTSTQVGNADNGYAKITLTTVEIVSNPRKKSYEENHEWNYTMSKTYQKFIVPESGIYQIELWGAQGGTYSTTYQGGKGAYTSGEIYLEKNNVLYVYVGEQGNITANKTAISGGWNGGGNGGLDASASRNEVGGGGATDIRLTPTTSLSIWNEFESLKSRIMVAAGGGAGSGQNGGSAGTGGAGGGLIGYSGTSKSSYYGSGATENYGGRAMGYDAIEGRYLYSHGNFGSGGSDFQEGGGGGYFGGGGAGSSDPPAGGGSSYISGHDGCASILNTTDLVLTGSAYHYSGYYFTDTQMIDGEGYSWTKYKSSKVNQPTYNSSSTQIGQSGNGYAKITLKRIETKDDDHKENVWNYEYTPNYQIFTTPYSGTYQIELWGAQGGTYSTSYPGGKGAYTSGEIYLEKNTTLYVYVGSQGYLTTNKNWSSGGWNGGGIGGNDATSSRTEVGGGGATDIRTIKTTSLSTWHETNSLKSRIMVAAGGGAGSGQNGGSVGQGGSGGGLIGYDGNNSSRKGTGATQISGGYSYETKTFNGGFGYGGDSQDGGGSGWYGGGGASNADPPAGGGSSYISGHAGCIAVTSSGTPKVTSYSKIDDSISYTGYKFVNTVMIDGNGYSWTTSKSSSSSKMPSYYGTSLVTGNTENGHARITYLGS